MLPTSGITIYHNPQCSKSRNTAKFLEDNKADIYSYETVEYESNPPTTEILNALVDYLGIRDQDPARRPWDYLLRREAQSKASSFEEAFDIIIENPGLLERPFVVDWDRKIAALGRPDLSQIQTLIEGRKTAKI